MILSLKLATLNCMLSSRTTVNMWTAPAAIPRMAPYAAHPSKAGKIKVSYAAALLCPHVLSVKETMLLHHYWILPACFHTGLVPESPTFFNSSPFKVLSPQPPKFLKSLLPVKEENKAKKPLESRPLLGQEVRRGFDYLAGWMQS